MWIIEPAWVYFTGEVQGFLMKDMLVDIVTTEL